MRHEKETTSQSVSQAVRQAGWPCSLLQQKGEKGPCWVCRSLPRAPVGLVDRGVKGVILDENHTPGLRQPSRTPTGWRGTRERGRGTLSFEWHLGL